MAQVRRANAATRISDGQVHTLDKGGIELSREAYRLQGTCEIFLGPQPHHVRHLNHLPPSVAFFHLAVEQARCHLPPAYLAPSSTHLSPLSKMSREGIKVQIEAIAGEEWNAAWSQEPSQRVNNRMCHVLCAGTQLEDGKQLGVGINRQPQKDESGWHGGAWCAAVVQLQMRGPEGAEIVLV